MALASHASTGFWDIAGIYDHSGFIFPIDVVSADEAATLRADLEAAEAALADDPERLALLRSYPDRLLPSFDKLIRNDKLIDAARKAGADVHACTVRVSQSL